MSAGTTSGTSMPGDAVPSTTPPGAALPSVLASTTLASTALASTAGAENRERWAALDQRNERLVDFSHPLLAELRRDHPDIDRRLQAAS